MSMLVEYKYGEHADVGKAWTDEDKLIILRINVILRIVDENKLLLGNKINEKKEEKDTAMHHCILPHSVNILE